MYCHYSTVMLFCLITCPFLSFFIYCSLSTQYDVSQRYCEEHLRYPNTDRQIHIKAQKYILKLEFEQYVFVFRENS